MKFDVSPEAVLADIGEKPLAAFAEAVRLARADFALYRRTFPAWVSGASSRGLANWIHDRLLDHLLLLVEDVPGLDVVESGPTRDVYLGLNYRFRVKRHDGDSRITSYPTDSFLEFVDQPALRLPGMEEIRLCAGYEWDAELVQILDAVLSMRDGTDNVLWTAHLPETSAGSAGVVTVVTPSGPMPAAPAIITSDGAEEGKAGSE